MSPRIPARHLVSNLIAANEGEWWGLWRVTPPTYARMSARERHDWHARVSAALTGIQTDSMILDVAQPVEADEVAASMIEGVDIARHPRWARAARDAHDTISAGGYTRRATFLAVRLPAAKSLRGRLASARSGVGGRFGLAALPPSGDEVDSATRAAAAIEAPLRSLLGAARLRPSTVGEAEWLYARAGVRGLAALPASAFADDGRVSTRLAAVGGAAVIFEGGTEADAGRGSNRRYLRADSEGGSAYQAFAAFAHLPRQFVYPGGQGELLAELAQLGDWVETCVRITPTANSAAKAAVLSQVRKLTMQVDEYQGDKAGTPGSLLDARAGCLELFDELNASPQVPEEQVAIIVSVSAPTLALTNERMAAVSAAVGANDYDLQRPIGHQGALWEAMLPGSSTPAVCGHYRQYLLPKGIAGLAPLTGSALGDGRGPVVGLNLDAGGAPVQFWAGTGPNMADPRSGSTGIFGRLGAGKSWAAKGFIADTVEMGGQVLVTDRTAMCEYGRLGEVFRGWGYSSQVVDLGAESRFSLDPLSMFARLDDRVRYATGFLSLMAGLAPTGAEAAVLETAIRRVATRDGRLAEVVEELRGGGDDDAVFRDAAQRVALQVAVFTRGALASLVFDPARPPVRLDADYIVFHAPHLDLPSREELADRSSLLPEQVFSTALLYLVAAVARDVAFSRRDRFSLIVQDEGYVLSNPQGDKLLGEILRDGRKHNAALIYGSHHPADLKADLAQLLGSSFLFRMARDAAPAALRAMGYDVTPGNVDLIAEENRAAGQCLYRDLAGRAGLVQILAAKTPELAAAFDTGLTNLTAPARKAVARRRYVGAA